MLFELIYRGVYRVFISHPPHLPEGTKQNEQSNALWKILVNNGNTTPNYAKIKTIQQYTCSDCIFSISSEFDLWDNCVMNTLTIVIPCSAMLSHQKTERERANFGHSACRSDLDR